MKSINLRLEDGLHAAVVELAAVNGWTLTDCVVRSLRLFLEIQGRTHERSWRLGESDGLGSAAGWVDTHAKYLEGDAPEAVIVRLRDIARRLGKLQHESRKLAEGVPVGEPGKRWPASRTRNAHWRVCIEGCNGPPVYVPGEPTVGDYVFDRGQYFLVDRVEPQQLQITLLRMLDSEEMRRLRHQHPERFRSISTRVTSSA